MHHPSVQGTTISNMGTKQDIGRSHVPALLDWRALAAVDLEELRHNFWPISLDDADRNTHILGLRCALLTILNADIDAEEAAATGMARGVSVSTGALGFRVCGISSCWLQS
jgi:hypothetical protein